MFPYVVVSMLQIVNALFCVSTVLARTTNNNTHAVLAPDIPTFGSEITNTNVAVPNESNYITKVRVNENENLTLKCLSDIYAQQFNCTNRAIQWFKGSKKQRILNVESHKNTANGIKQNRLARRQGQGFNTSCLSRSRLNNNLVIQNVSLKYSGYYACTLRPIGMNKKNYQSNERGAVKWFNVQVIRPKLKQYEQKNNISSHNVSAAAFGLGPIKYLFSIGSVLFNFAIFATCLSVVSCLCCGGCLCL